jgi:hypothetical protein
MQKGAQVVVVCLGQAAWTVLGALDLARGQAVPSAAKALMASRTVWAAQPRVAVRQFAQVMYRWDAGALQLPGDLRSFEEAGRQLGVAAVFFLQHLNGQHAVELRIEAAEHESHTAFAENALDGISRHDGQLGLRADNHRPGVVIRRWRRHFFGSRLVDRPIGGECTSIAVAVRQVTRLATKRTNPVNVGRRYCVGHIAPTMADGQVYWHGIDRSSWRA